MTHGVNDVQPFRGDVLIHTSARKTNHSTLFFSSILRRKAVPSTIVMAEQCFGVVIGMPPPNVWVAFENSRSHGDTEIRVQLIPYSGSTVDMHLKRSGGDIFTYRVLSDNGAVTRMAGHVANALTGLVDDGVWSGVQSAEVRYDGAYDYFTKDSIEARTDVDGAAFDEETILNATTRFSRDVHDAVEALAVYCQPTIKSVNINVVYKEPVPMIKALASPSDIVPINVGIDAHRGPVEVTINNATFHDIPVFLHIERDQRVRHQASYRARAMSGSTIIGSSRYDPRSGEFTVDDPPRRGKITLRRHHQEYMRLIVPHLIKFVVELVEYFNRAGVWETWNRQKITTMEPTVHRPPGFVSFNVQNRVKEFALQLYNDADTSLIASIDIQLRNIDA